MTTNKEEVEEIKGAVEGEDSDKKSSKKKASKEEKEPELTDLPGIGPAVAAKLETAGIFDLMSLAVMSPAALSDAAGVSSAVARKAIQASRNMLSLGFSDGMEFAKKRSNVFHVTTGSKNLDELLGGKGLESRSITEAFGAFGSGKCVSKDTPVCYFNDTRMHVEQIEKTYQKYKQKKGEVSVGEFGEGKAVPIDSVKVLAWDKGKFKVTKADNLYREKVKKLFKIKTKRGRELKVTGKHQLLSFSKGVNWKKTRELKKGDLIASPKKIDLETENSYNKDDAYFLGLFVAEGTSNPLSISTGSEQLKNWVFSYISSKFGYSPTIREDKRREKICYTILFRDKTKEFLGGLEECNAGNKFIPEPVFLSNEEVVFSFLGGYFDGDAEVSKNDISATTKSKTLATQLSYLLLRLGITASFTKRKSKKYGEFFVIRISGEDRERIKDVGFKLKRFDCSLKNNSNGYPKKIISFISELYKHSLGGNRGRLRKQIGKRNLENVNKTVYSNLINNYNGKTIETKTLKNIEKVFLEQKREFVKILNKLQNENLTAGFLKKIFPQLPFAFNSLAKDMGVKKKTMENYYQRKLPENKSELLKNLIINELKTRIDTICLVLEIISEIRLFSWDEVESIEEIDYNDYVYDFVVPEGHSFVGGNMPTMMHNTQLSLAFAVNCQLPVEQGGAGGKCVFIDTEGTFRPERVRQMAEGIGADPEKVLKNIMVARAFNSDHQILLLERVAEMVKEGEPIKIMIIDSLTAHFRAEYSGRGQLADRQQKLNRYMHELMKLSETHNLAVYVTNQVMANPAQLFGDPTTAIGGNIVGHACLTGDSLIQLADGSIREIKEFEKDKIFSGDLNKLRLEKVDTETKFINPDINKIYNIQTTNQINCSSLHRFFVINNFSLVEKEAMNLKEGDFVAQAGRIDFEGEEQNLPPFNLKKIGKISKKQGVFVSGELKKENLTRKEVCKKVGITPRQFRRVLNQSYPTNMEVFDKLKNSFSNQLQLQISPFYTYKHQNLIMPEVMGFQLAQVCGYFIGDGNFENRGLRFRDERLEVLRNYQGFFKNLFNIEGKISKMSNKNCFTLSINSKEIADFFRLIIPDVLNYIAKSTKEVVAGFIRGFVDAEGHIDKKRPRITIAQKEKQILRYLQLFLLRFGIRSFLRLDVGKKRISNLSIRDRDVKGYFQIGFSAQDKQKKLIKWIDYSNKTYSKEMMPLKRKEIWDLLKDAGLKPSLIIKSRPEDYTWINKEELKKAHSALMNIKINDRQIKQKIEFIFKLLNSDFRFEKIRKINILKNEKKELLFDFSVPKTENYLANGFVVHNSTYRLYLRRAKQGSRVAKLIDSPNLPDGEAVYFVTTHGVRDKA